ncbi:MAG: GntR family transcriptional regulator [Gemmatimonadales bacterium]|jgi:DNA-binding GntR family transcriptional regulator|nr:GntR family transcriptional regulator [Gemmatimonadales bacterium]MBT4186592.1 GntR family transcriptional regulator [Gemmatimonadales bacterium]MBT6373719.1 GntR family transcriptional regulator [Gemmatimonadales bacterium]MBT7690494.1 GntR family transcriptional regulator [Gemmatimonadales bacterium]
MIKRDAISEVGTLHMEPPTSISEAVADTLRSAILNGQLKAGQKLPQAQIAEQLGVSRIPLRDALRRLEVEGLVLMDDRRGASVAEVSMEELDEIFQMRILLEPSCAEAAVGKLTDGEADRLIKLLLAMDETDAAEPLAAMSARRDFYQELYSMSGRPRITETILLLRDHVSRFHVLQHDDGCIHAHQALRTCIESRDGKAAREVVGEHLMAAHRDQVPDAVRHRNAVPVMRD